MDNDFKAEIAAEVERISSLPLEEQVVAFNALRERLETELNQTSQQSA